MFENSKKEINENIVPGKNAGTSATGLKETLLTVLDDARDAIADANFGIIGAITTTQELSVLNSLPDGVYEAQTSGLYKNGLTAKEGYYTRFRKTANSWSLESETKIPMQDLTPLENRTTTLEDEIEPIKSQFTRDEQFYFTLDGAVLSSIPTGRTIIRNQALTKSASFKYLRIYASQAGIFQVGIFEKSAPTTMKALRYSVELTLNEGYQVVELPSIITANIGEYIGIYCKTGCVFADATKASQLGGDRVFTSGQILVGETQTTTGTSNYDLFSLFENYTIDEKIDNATNKVKVVDIVDQNNTNAVQSGAVYSYIQPIKQKFDKYEPFKYTLDGALLISRPTLRTIIRNKALTEGATFKYLNIFLAVGGKIQVGVFVKPTKTTAQAVAYTDEITLPAGNQIVELPTALTAAAGQYIGIYFTDARVYADGNRGGQLGGNSVLIGSKMGTDKVVTVENTSSYDLFSLFENYTIEEEIDKISKPTVIGSGAVLAKNTITNTTETINPLYITDTFGFNQPLHPTVIERTTNGYKYVMVQTPYPRTNVPVYKDRYECPTIHYSNDLFNWTAGILIDDLTAEEIANKDYFSDPELVLNTDTNELELWYRITRAFKEVNTSILRRKINIDGTMTERETILTPAQMGATDPTIIRSPAMIYEDNKYKMWFTGWTNANVGYVEFYNANELATATFTKVTLPAGSPNCWHLDVIKDNGVYYLLNNTTSFNLTLLSSPNGITFTRVADLLTKTLDNRDFYGQTVYRSSAIKVGNLFYVFVSGWNTHANIGLMIGDSLTNLNLVDGGYIRQDIRVGGNIRLNNTVYVKSLIELDDRGNALGFDYATQTLFFQRADGTKIKIAN